MNLAVGRRGSAAQISISQPTNLMYASEIRPILRTRHQSGPHWILTNILPPLRIVLAVTQPMMKTASLKSSRIWMHFREAVFPETHPALDGKFQIMRCTEQMEMIRHEKIITDEPRRSSVFPDVVQCALNRGLRQPASAFFGADGEENPIRPAGRNVNAFLRRATTGFAEGDFAHGNFSTAMSENGKDF